MFDNIPTNKPNQQQGDDAPVENQPENRPVDNNLLSDVPQPGVATSQAPPPVDIPTPNSSAPSGSSKGPEPEDIFAEVDKTADDYSDQPPDMNLPTKFDQSQPTAKMPGLSDGKRSVGKTMLIVVGVLVSAVVAAWAVYSFFIAPKSTVDEGSEDTNNLPAAATLNTNVQIPDDNIKPLPVDVNVNNNVNTNINKPVEPIKPKDTDGDGLSDDDELKMGTDPRRPDTDGDNLSDQDEVIKYKTDPKAMDSDNDGLSDSEEIRNYKTNPNKADTDGDGYTDGEEVQNGYNPAGDGKLMDTVNLP